MAGISSFSFLVRMEGIFLLPIYGLGALIKGKYKSLPWFFLGFIVYSIIGFFYYKDIFWLITEMPYRGATDLYGTGSLDYYLKKIIFIFGHPITYLIVIGIIALIINLFKKKENSHSEIFTLLLPALIFFAAHSVMWWSGIGNSNGALRYFAGATPYFALIALAGLNLILRIFEKFSWSKYLIYLIVASTTVFCVRTMFQTYDFPTQLNKNQLVFKECSEWLEETNYLEKKFYYVDPSFLYFLDFNAYDKDVSRVRVYNDDHPELHIEKGSIVIWDSGFCSDKLLNNLITSEYYSQIKMFQAKGAANSDKKQFHLIIFQKIK